MRSSAVVALPVVVALVVGAVRTAGAVQEEPRPDPASRDATATGRDLWLGDCGICHGEDGTGRAGVPSIQGVGASGVHFMVSTGRMPVDEPDDEARRGPVNYEPAEIDALVAYASTIIAGPGVPVVDLSDADVAAGGADYRLHCATCHQMVGQGGILPGGRNVPPLGAATPVQVVEAMRSGPNDMPVFPEALLDDDAAAAIAAYLRELDHPRDRGGWDLGHWGPVPEGAVALVLGLLPLVVIVRRLGDRNPPAAQEDELR